LKLLASISAGWTAMRNGYKKQTCYINLSILFCIISLWFLHVASQHKGRAFLLLPEVHDFINNQGV
jgi:hypothetical protein